MTDTDDLLWHGAALCRAIHRAQAAEARAEAAEAEAAELRGHLDHCLAMGGQGHEQVSDLCRALDEARAEAADLRAELAYRLGEAGTVRVSCVRVDSERPPGSW